MGTLKPNSQKPVQPRKRRQNCLRDTQCSKSKSLMRRRRSELECEPIPSKQLVSNRAPVVALATPSPPCKGNVGVLRCDRESAKNSTFRAKILWLPTLFPVL